MSFIFVLFMLHLLTVCALYVCLCDYVNIFMLHLLTVCALYVCLCDYVNIFMYLVLLCIFGKKLLRACVYCYTITEFK